MSNNVIEPLVQNTSELLTVDQFAKLLKVSRTTVFALLNTGELQEGVHYIRLGRVLRFRWVLDLLFSKKSKTSSKRKPKKRPTSPEIPKSLSASAVNLEYGTLTA